MAISALAGTAIATGIANAVGNVGGTILNQYNADKTRQFNREEAEKNRAFQREMAQNNIKYAVTQANELGISPSLVLGNHTNALGGSQASVGNPSTSNASGLGQLASVLQEENRLRTTEEMNEDRLQANKDMNEARLRANKEMNEKKLETMKEIQRMKMSNSTTNADEYIKRNGYKDRNDFNKRAFDNLDDWQI